MTFCQPCCSAVHTNTVPPHTVTALTPVIVSSREDWSFMGAIHGRRHRGVWGYDVPPTFVVCTPQGVQRNLRCRPTVHQGDVDCLSCSVLFSGVVMFLELLAPKVDQSRLLSRT